MEGRKCFQRAKKREVKCSVPKTGKHSGHNHQSYEFAAGAGTALLWQVSAQTAELHLSATIGDFEAEENSFKFETSAGARASVVLGARKRKDLWHYEACVEEKTAGSNSSLLIMYRGICL